MPLLRLRRMSAPSYPGSSSDIRQPGRDSSSGRCVRPTEANRSAHTCTLLVTLPGSFTSAGNAGTDHFRFTGRLDGDKLAVGHYRLIATPTTDGKTGLTASVASAS
jgi:hypothetical protein